MVYWETEWGGGGTHLKNSLRQRLVIINIDQEKKKHGGREEAAYSTECLARFNQTCSILVSFPLSVIECTPSMGVPFRACLCQCRKRESIKITISLPTVQKACRIWSFLRHLDKLCLVPLWAIIFIKLMYIHHPDTYTRPVCFEAGFAGIITFTVLQGFLIQLFK